MWTSVGEFLTNILSYMGEMITTITGNGTLAVFVLAIPLVSFAVVFPICDKYVVSDMPSELVTVR